MAPPMDQASDKLVRRTAMVGGVTAAYFLLTADYGPTYPNPINKAMESAKFSLKDLFFGSGRKTIKEEQEAAQFDGKK